ncbi:metal ABC transporter solute-binding protein, Zn/Mn family [Speluncibacter jeojiensis]|uniref:metal ABC transporter solute-binding protein, Zn/Mn family n=1 Tax=Speluncibacter jeojiensis TaxID=2710754 RepID=UPI00240EBD78|nr:zinc ABC transporter substrate-binding protein [Rhodococcus sp. D2-41]
MPTFPRRRRALRRRRGALIAATLTAGALTLAACTSPGTSSGHDGRPQVVASTNVWGGIAKTIGGDAVDVTTLIGDPGTDPHDYQTTPSDAAKVAKADLVIYNGGGYDKFASDIVESVGSGKRTVDAYALPVTGALGSTRTQSDPNEHVWYDPATVDAVARTIADDLAAIDPAGAATFHANADALRGRLQSVADLAARIDEQRRGTKVIETEPVLHYLLAQSGLVDIAPQEFTEAVEQGTDPSPAAVAEIGRLLGSKQASALVYNTQTQDPTTKAVLQRAHDASIPVVDVTESMPADVDYTQWVTGELTALGKAVGAL